MCSDNKKTKFCLLFLFKKYYCKGSHQLLYVTKSKVKFYTLEKGYVQKRRNYIGYSRGDFQIRLTIITSVSEVVRIERERGKELERKRMRERGEKKIRFCSKSDDDLSSSFSHPFLLFSLLLFSS